MKLKWLSRDLVVGPYLALCLSQKAFDRHRRHLGHKDHALFVNEGADATTHTYAKDGSSTCVVCLGPTKGRSKASIYALLVHEAVHVFQAHCDDIGEKRPSIEFEAYAIQAISERLFDSYVEQSK